MKTERQDISLYIANAYLEGLYCNACNLFDDEKYASAYNALRERVNEMFDTGIESDITDMYVIVEHEETNEVQR